MKIYINYKADEDSEVTAVVEAIKDAMLNFSIKTWDSVPDKKGDGTHEVYFIGNGKHLGM